MNSAISVAFIGLYSQEKPDGAFQYRLHQEQAIKVIPFCLYSSARHSVNDANAALLDA
jgi:hypothetical protein